MDRDRVLIAGGGIGGLAAALALAQKNIPSLVLEKASRLGEIGAGIQLGPNAFHCFDRLGVGETARQMAVYIDQLRLMDSITDGEICHIDLQAGRENTGALQHIFQLPDIARPGVGEQGTLCCGGEALGWLRGMRQEILRQQQNIL